MLTSRSARPTDLILPDESSEPDPVADAAAAAEELDWSYNDAELTMQLKAAHKGRTPILVMLAASALAVTAAIALVL